MKNHLPFDFCHLNSLFPRSRFSKYLVFAKRFILASVERRGAVRLAACRPAERRLDFYCSGKLAEELIVETLLDLCDLPLEGSPPLRGVGVLACLQRNVSLQGVGQVRNRSITIERSKEVRLVGRQCHRVGIDAPRVKRGADTRLSVIDPVLDLRVLNRIGRIPNETRERGTNVINGAVAHRNPAEGEMGSQ